jgi:hypothetical protein
MEIQQRPNGAAEPDITFEGLGFTGDCLICMCNSSNGDNKPNGRGEHPVRRRKQSRWGRAANASKITADAVADGIQVEATKTAAEAGISYPVFITRSVYEQYVAVPAGVTCQDEAGRLWDIVWMLRFAIQRSRGEHYLRVALYVRNSDSHPAQLVTLPLTRTVTVETPQIPDRDTAECELTQLRRKYGENLIKATIRKDRGSRREGRIWAAPGTYTLNYTTRDQQTQPLF